MRVIDGRDPLVRVTRACLIAACNSGLPSGKPHSAASRTHSA